VQMRLKVGYHAWIHVDTLQTGRDEDRLRALQPTTLQIDGLPRIVRKA